MSPIDRIVIINIPRLGFIIHILQFIKFMLFIILFKE